MLIRAITLLAVLVSGWANAAQWQPNRVVDDPTRVNTFVRDVDGSPVKSFRGVVDVEADLAQLLAVTGAVDAFADWVFQAKEAERLSEPDRAIYIGFNGIWPVSDRDVVLVNTLFQDSNTGAVTLTSKNVAGQPDRDGYVRIPALDNRFIFTPLGNGWSRIEFETFVNPGGRVPAWLSNIVSTRAPLHTLRGLREQLQTERFQVVAEKDQASFPGIEGIDFSYWE